MVLEQVPALLNFLGRRRLVAGSGFSTWYARNARSSSHTSLLAIPPDGVGWYSKNGSIVRLTPSSSPRISEMRVRRDRPSIPATSGTAPVSANQYRSSRKSPRVMDR